MGLLTRFLLAASLGRLLGKTLTLVVVEVRAVHNKAEFEAYQAAAREQMLRRDGVVLGRGGVLFRWRSAQRTYANSTPALRAAFREWQAGEE